MSRRTTDRFREWKHMVIHSGVTETVGDKIA
ncbi:Hypothetical protein I5071_200 (plasmid) [Sandaracinus amylolyticus]|nr:Hypothetical protein I5071_200 [Sandaracinus amylolyticus]